MHQIRFRAGWPVSSGSAYRESPNAIVQLAPMMTNFFQCKHGHQSEMWSKTRHKM